MNNKAYDLTSYVFAKDEKILIDTNIWLYLYPPPCDPHRPWADQYSRAIRDLKKAEAIAVLDPMVMSEYLNSYCRTVWNAEFKKKYPVFKKFRLSKDFASLVPSLRAYARSIIAFSTVHAVAAYELNLNQAMNNFLWFFVIFREKRV